MTVRKTVKVFCFVLTYFDFFYFHARARKIKPYVYNLLTHCLGNGIRGDLKKNGMKILNLIR